jgi:hypothetical protein
MWVQISLRARWTILCDKVCQWLATGRWFSLCPLVSSTNKTDSHYRTEIVLKVALSTIKQITNKHNLVSNRTYLSLDWVHSHYACICIRKWQSVTYKNEVTVTLTLTTGSNSWFFYHTTLSIAELFCHKAQCLHIW